MNEKLRFTAVGMLFVYMFGLHTDMNAAHTVTVAASVFFAYIFFSLIYRRIVSIVCCIIIIIWIYSVQFVECEYLESQQTWAKRTKQKQLGTIAINIAYDPKFSYIVRRKRCTFLFGSFFSLHFIYWVIWFILVVIFLDSREILL